MSNQTIHQTDSKQDGIFLGDQFLQTSVVHTNLGQEVVITTTDKLKLSLLDYQKYIRSQSDWIPTVAILISTITVLVAAEFKDFAHISADSWQSLFILIAVGSAIWSFINICRAILNRKRSGINKIIEQIKSQSLD